MILNHLERTPSLLIHPSRHRTPKELKTWGKRLIIALIQLHYYRASQAWSAAQKKRNIVVRNMPNMSWLMISQKEKTRRKIKRIKLLQSTLVHLVKVRKLQPNPSSLQIKQQRNGTEAIGHQRLQRSWNREGFYPLGVSETWLKLHKAVTVTYL